MASYSSDAPLSPPTIGANPATGIVTGQGTTLTVTKGFNGGTSPYTCQWFQEPPGSTTFSSLGSSFGGNQGCDIGRFPYASTGPLSNGTWFFLLQVTDSTPAPLTPQTVESGSVGVTVSYLGIKLALSIYAIDFGQSQQVENFAANATFAGGVPPYSVTFYSGASSSCSSDKNNLGTLKTGMKDKFVVFPLNAPVSKTYYCARVTDSSSPPVTEESQTVLFAVNPELRLQTSPSTPNIDSGQNASITATPSGGTPPYQYQWFRGFGCIGSNALTRRSPNSSTYTTENFTTSIATHHDFSVNVTDSSMATKQLESACAPVRVTVNPALSAVISPTTSTIAAGEFAQLFATASEGTYPYTFQWYAGGNCAAGGGHALAGKAAYFLMIWPKTTTTYSVLVTDSPQGAPPEIVCANATVTVNSALSAPKLVFNAYGIDVNQTATITANITWAGGTPPYSAKLYSGSSSNCALDTATVPVLLGSNPNSTSATSIVFTFASPSSNTMYCASVAAGVGPFQIQFSAVQQFSLNIRPTALISYSPSPPIVSGSSVTLTAHASKGTLPYSYQWYSGSACVGDLQGKSQTLSTQVWINQPAYSVLVRDSSIGVPALSFCASVAMNVVTTLPQIPTSLKLSCTPSSVVVGFRTKCTALVAATGPEPTGAVTWSGNSSNGILSSPSCTLSHGACSVWFRSNVTGSFLLSGNYTGDTWNSHSAGTTTVTSRSSGSKIHVTCAPTSLAASSTKTIKCKATVTGYVPTGTVTWLWSGTGTISLTPGATCDLVRGKVFSCFVTFNVVSAGTITISATYSGDPNNLGSASNAAKLTIR